MTRTRTQLLLQLAAAFLLVLGVQARTWTSADGSKTFEGELQSYDAASGKVSVTLPNGRQMIFSQDKLSEEDVAWLKKNGGRSGGSTAEVEELPDENEKKETASRDPLGEAFEARNFKGSDGTAMPYRIHLPKNANMKKNMPLLIYYHGAGSRGDNNRSQLGWVTDILGYVQKKEMDVIIVAPQCASGEQWVNTPWTLNEHTMPEQASIHLKASIELIGQLQEEFSIDEKRLYVTGLSMGGFAVWDVIQRNPDLFAAAIPVCGGGDEKEAKKLTKIPIWAFHGGRDRVVKTIRSRNMIEAIKDAGGKPKYTEYPGVGHDSWSATYKNDEVFDWMYSQKK